MSRRRKTLRIASKVKSLRAYNNDIISFLEQEKERFKTLTPFWEKNKEEN